MALGLVPSPCPIVPSADVPVQFTKLQPTFAFTLTVDVIVPSVFVALEAPLSAQFQVT